MAENTLEDTKQRVESVLQMREITDQEKIAFIGAIQNTIESFLKNSVPDHPIKNKQKKPTIKHGELEDWRPSEIYVSRQALPALGRKENIVEFLRRVWGPRMLVSPISRTELRRADPSADTAVENWLRKNPLPREIRLMTKKETINAELSRFRTGNDMPLRLDWVLKSRARRAKKQYG